MGKKKKDPSKAGLGSPEVEAQGTTNEELQGGVKASSSRKQTRN
ncbi:YuzL family protein [Bacillus sp. KH172YL63]|nr:YuzL family protein [Bacillus sp. KH172YL63]BCB04269.1 hypothetical protein KH172YL63_24020 [Bacillus sp. KH172YL63]